MYILTHRGLDPSKEDYFTESSREAFEDQLARGFGLEFDLQYTKDGKIIISHDGDFSRVSKGTETRAIKELTEKEIRAFVFSGCHIASLPDLLKLIGEKGSRGNVHAIHLKHSSQTKELLDTLLENLRESGYEKFILFDITLDTAKYLKAKNPNLNLAPSVAHPFDIERYNNAVGGTLMSVEEVLAHPDLFSWVWLDEWGTTDKDNGTKKFYTKEIFEEIRGHGLKIALVTPELHATSPNLLVGESHSDAETKEKLFGRMKEIADLTPDAMCTDYPDQLKRLLV